MKRIVILIAAGSLLAACAAAQSGPSRSLMLYAVTNNPITGAAEFGAADIGSGTWVQIGSGLTPDLGHALLPVSGTSVLSLGFSGKLYKIDLRSGAASVVGATGLADCSTPASPCGGTSANTIARLNSSFYAIDFNQTLYAMDPATGATKPIGPTGMPPVPFVPISIDPATGRLNLFVESMFAFQGKLYANFDAFQLDLSNGSTTTVIPAALYEINPVTGHATLIAPTAEGLLTIVPVNDTVYGFDAINFRFVTVNMQTGQTHVVGGLDPAAGNICGATPARPQ